MLLTCSSTALSQHTTPCKTQVESDHTLLYSRLAKPLELWAKPSGHRQKSLHDPITRFVSVLVLVFGGVVSVSCRCYVCVVSVSCSCRVGVMFVSFRCRVRVVSVLCLCRFGVVFVSFRCRVCVVSVSRLCRSVSCRCRVCVVSVSCLCRFGVVSVSCLCRFGVMFVSFRCRVRVGLSHVLMSSRVNGSRKQDFCWERFGSFSFGYVNIHHRTI